MRPAMEPSDAFCQKLRNAFARDRFARFCGIEILDISPGRARARMTLQSHHLNGLDMGHGGAIFTLADLAFAVASNSHGTQAVAINVSINYLKAAREGMTLVAEAVEDDKNPKLGTYTVRVTDQTGELLALFHGMAYRKKAPLISPDPE